MNQTQEDKKFSHKFFQNTDCKNFPCHKNIPEEDFNCLFCFCPLYCLGKSCGGNFQYTEKGIKSCINCNFPHLRQNYDQIIEKTKLSIMHILSTDK